VAQAKTEARGETSSQSLRTNKGEKNLLRGDLRLFWPREKGENRTARERHGVAVLGKVPCHIGRRKRARGGQP